MQDVVLEHVSQVAEDRVSVRVELVFLGQVDIHYSLHELGLVHNVGEVEVDSDHSEVVIDQVVPVCASERQDKRSDQVLNVGVSKFCVSSFELLHVVFKEPVQHLVLTIFQFPVRLVSGNLDSVSRNLHGIIFITLLWLIDQVEDI